MLIHIPTCLLDIEKCTAGNNRAIYIYNTKSIRSNLGPLGLPKVLLVMPDTVSFRHEIYSLPTEPHYKESMN